MLPELGESGQRALSQGRPRLPAGLAPESERAALVYLRAAGVLHAAQIGEPPGDPGLLRTAFRHRAPSEFAEGAILALQNILHFLDSTRTASAAPREPQ